MNTTPQFCVIAPTAYLSTYATRSRTHLVLAHIVANDPYYAAFYKNLANEGHFIMCDNGAFELGEPYDPESLVEIGKKCGAHALVLPDYPFQDAAKTVEAAKDYIETFKTNGFQTFFVPQSLRGDLEGWIRSYKWAANHPHIDIIGMSILGIPGALSHIPPAYARVVMAQILIDRQIINRSKYHHWLGLNAGPALEIPALLSMGVLNSCDSSAPVWQGILGVEYTQNSDSFSPVKKIHFPVDFNYPFTKDQETHRRISRNLDLTLSLFGGTP